MGIAVRPTPEQLLRQVEAEEEYNLNGKLKVFLGYASGVGKSYRMLDEGRRRQERGQNVVVAAIQTETSPQIEEAMKQLHVIPLRITDGVPAIDMDEILRRRPQVCLIDGLAYDNPPGSRNEHRWQDVEQLLAAGISVITTINLQYVQEHREEVARIRGKPVNVTVPEKFLRKADEIVIVDAPADSCLARNGAEVVNASPGVRQQKLSQLREIALLLAADVVDDQLESYLDRQGIHQTWGTQERILVCVTPRANAKRMIERAKLIRDRFHGELYLLYVGQRHLTSDGELALERNLSLGREAGAEVHLLEGEDAIQTIVEFAQGHGITQIFIGHSLVETWMSRFVRTPVDRLIRAAEGIDVKLFPH
jgi:two-component system, OmpR family, sensor histidine kinase KdpD